MKLARRLLLAFAILVLVLAAIFSWSVFATRMPAEWNPSLAGMERAAIHRTVGAPTTGNFAEKRMEQWSRDSVCARRVLEIYYTDSDRPSIATEVYLKSRWKFGIFTRDQHQEFVLGQASGASPRSRPERSVMESKAPATIAH